MGQCEKSHVGVECEEEIDFERSPRREETEEGGA